MPHGAPFASRLVGGTIASRPLADDPCQDPWKPHSAVNDDIYVSLDLEINGDAGKGAEIIEIGAVKFRGGEELASFHTLVRPERSLSYKVHLLTSIDEDQLQRAPRLPDVAQDLRDFVGTHVLVGQSIDLDLKRLWENGVHLENRGFIDTFRLAELLLPGLDSYDLGSVARELGLPSPVAHRALSDARQVYRVFLALRRRIDELGPVALDHIVRLAPHQWPLRQLFVEAARRRVRTAWLDSAMARSELDLLGVLPPAERRRESFSPSPHIKRLDIRSLTASLSPGGKVAEAFPGFEERPEQVQMMAAVARTFNEGGTLLVEAGTGTGKSLAYLLPAAHFAMLNGERVVVSTNTINLQDQLFHKDLPELQQATGLPFRYCRLKGRTNYLCLSRLLTMLRTETGELREEERTLLIKVLVWLKTTRTGDRAELRLEGAEETAWSRLCAHLDYCTPARCRFNRAGICFLARARAQAEESQIIVVNHALLLTDVLAGSVIPDYSHLVIDEAHHLEDVATEHLGWRVNQRELVASLDQLLPAGGDRSQGIVARAIDLLRRSTKPGVPAADLRAMAEGAYEAGLGARESIAVLFAALETLMEGRPNSADGTLLLDRTARRQSAWGPVMAAWEALKESLEALVGRLSSLLKCLDQQSAIDDEEWEEVMSDLSYQTGFLETARIKVQGLFTEPDYQSTIYWLAGVRREDIVLHIAPLHVGPLLQQGLYSGKRCIILSSATLSADGDMGYIKKRLGLEDARDLVVGSPFDYKQSTMVYIPTDVPEPGEPGFSEGAAEAILSLVTALGGRTLVLFTSYGQLRSTHSMVREKLDQEKILVLAQGVDGASRSRLLHAFKTTERAVLLGTSSFWEGVDVVGEALSCLVITRLPFSVPSDPVFRARSETFENPFSEYAVPQAILRFKQGFGRLIRSKTDRGVAVVLDRRVLSKGYGIKFLRSLPECVVRHGPVSALPEAALAWLTRWQTGARDGPVTTR